MADDVVKDALERFEESEEGSSFNREAAEADIRFSRLSEQWDDKIKKQREAEGRPCLTINKLPAFIRSVVNESRQNKPGIKVSPVDNGADVNTAEIIGGLIRSIERGSNAEIAYDTAIDHAVSGGFGFFRIGIDYVHDRSFEMEARIERVPNPLMVHWDVNSTEFDASDWEYAFISDLLTEDQFKLRYPKADPVHFQGDARDVVAHWLDDDQVRIAEYWHRAEESADLVLLSSGIAVLADELPRYARKMLERGGLDPSIGTDDEAIMKAMLATGVTEVRRRQTRVHKVTRRIMSGIEILEEEEWPGSTIPICPVWGEEVFLDGRRHFRSLIRDAKSPQEMFNFWRSATTELVALAPRAPWVGPVGFVPRGHEAKWETANTRSHAYLEYEPSQGGGVPQRQPFAGVPAGALQEAMNASDDMKAVISIYDPSLGAQSRETSGRAIMARQRESDTANFHFPDNLARAIRYAGRCLVDIIPAVYSARETIRILGEDSKEKVVRLVQDGGGKQGEDGEQELYDLSIGEYDVTVSTGANFATQREETRETLIEIMRQVPDAGPFIGDVLMEHMDFVGADKVSQRLRHLLPPEVRQAEDEDGMKALSPEARQALAQKDAALQQLQAQAQEMMGELKRLQDEATSKAAEMSAAREENATRAQLELEKIRGDMAAKQREFELKLQEIALKSRELDIKEADLELRRAVDIARLDTSSEYPAI